MTKRLMRGGDGTLVPYGLTCDHLWREIGLGYYSVFLPGEEQANCYCEKCFERLLLGQQVCVCPCCLCCAKALLANHHLIKEVEAS